MPRIRELLSPFLLELSKEDGNKLYRGCKGVIFPYSLLTPNKFFRWEGPIPSVGLHFIYLRLAGNEGMKKNMGSHNPLGFYI